MAEASAIESSVQISIPPNEVLLNVAHALNGRVEHLTRDVNAYTTCNKALDHVQALLQTHDRPLTLFRIPSRLEKEKLKELALSVNDPTPPRGPSSILNAIPAGQLPSPRRATLQERKILKENFAPKKTDPKPYMMIPASLEDGLLPTVAGKVKLSAIDGGELDPVVEISSDNCIWDTGAHKCYISEDLVEAIDPSFLGLEIHEAYRYGSNTCVQVDGAFSFSNKAFQIHTLFFVVPLSKLPNQRSGLLLGQHAFMNRLTFEMIPRSILEKRGTQPEAGIWGKLHIKTLLTLDEELEEY